MIRGDHPAYHNEKVDLSKRSDPRDIRESEDILGNNIFFQYSPPSGSPTRGTEPSTPSSLASGTSTVVIFSRDNTSNATSDIWKSNNLYSTKDDMIEIHLREVSASSTLAKEEMTKNTLEQLNKAGRKTETYLGKKKEESLDFVSTSNLDFLLISSDQSLDSKGDDYGKLNKKKHKRACPIRKVIKLKKSSTVNDTKNLIYRETHIPPYKQNLFFRGKKLNEYRDEYHAVSYNEDFKTMELRREERTISECGIVCNGETLLLLIKNRKEDPVFPLEDKTTLEKEIISIDGHTESLKRENIDILSANNVEGRKHISSMSSRSSHLSTETFVRRDQRGDSVESLSNWFGYYSSSTSSSLSTDVDIHSNVIGNNVKDNSETKSKSEMTSNTRRNNRSGSPISSTNQSNVNIMVRGPKVTVTPPTPFFCLYDGPIIPAELPKRINTSIKNIQRNFFLGKNPPKRAEDGTGGSYFMMDCDRRILGVFKPHDEEPYTPNNPNEFVRDFPSNHGRDRKPIENFDTSSRNPPHENFLENYQSQSSSLLGPFHFSYSMKNYATEINDNFFQLLPGSIPGEGYLREVGAYLIDRRQGNTAGVPATVICESYHPAYNYSASGTSNTNSSLTTAKPGDAFSVKYGSFQQYVHSDGDISGWGPSNFSIYEVQKIALLDIRILNMDRNDGNILVQKERKKVKNLHSPKSLNSYNSAAFSFSSTSSMDDSYLNGSFGGGEEEYNFRLVPIDHGHAFPEDIHVQQMYVNLCWSEWKQVKEPIHPKLIEVISNWDIDGDQDILRTKLGIKEKALDNFKIMSILLQAAVKINAKQAEEKKKKEILECGQFEESITLKDIFQMMVREGFEDDSPSELEKLIKACEELTMQSLLLSRTKQFRKYHNRGLHSDMPTKEDEKYLYSKLNVNEGNKTIGIVQLDQQLSSRDESIKEEHDKDPLDPLDVSSTTLTASLRLQSFQEESEDDGETSSIQKHNETNESIAWLNGELDKEMEREAVLKEQTEYSSFEYTSRKQTATTAIDISKNLTKSPPQTYPLHRNSTDLRLLSFPAGHSSSLSSSPSSPNLQSSFMTPTSTVSDNLQFPFSASISSIEKFNRTKSRRSLSKSERVKKKRSERDDNADFYNEHDLDFDKKSKIGKSRLSNSQYYPEGNKFLSKRNFKEDFLSRKPSIENREEQTLSNKSESSRRYSGEDFDESDEVSSSSSSDSESSFASCSSSSSESSNSTSDSDSDLDSLSIFIGGDDSDDEKHLANSLSCSPRTTSMHINSFIEKVKKDMEKKNEDVLSISDNMFVESALMEEGQNDLADEIDNSRNFFGKTLSSANEIEAVLGMREDSGEANQPSEDTDIHVKRSSSKNNICSSNEINTTIKRERSSSRDETDTKPSICLPRSISTPNFVSSNPIGKGPNRIPQFIRNTFGEGLRTPLSSANSSSINLSSKLSDLGSNESSYVGCYAPGTLSRGRSMASSEEWQMKMQSDIRHSVEFRSVFFQTLQAIFDHTLSRKLSMKKNKRDI